MSTVLDEVLAANEEYAASFGSKCELALPPARGFAILTCMDARLDPAKYAGLAEGDAHVIRNAGGRASDDAIRSLVISYKLLGTKEWFVIHHSDCGMEFFTDTVIRGLLENSLETAALGEDGFYDVGTGPGSSEGDYIDWLTVSHREQAVVEDVRRIRNHPLVPGRIPVYGYVYDVGSGRLIEVPGRHARGCRTLTGGRLASVSHLPSVAAGADPDRRGYRRRSGSADPHSVRTENPTEAPGVGVTCTRSLS